MVKPFKVTVTGIKGAQAYLTAKKIETKILAAAGVADSGKFFKKEVQASIKGNRAEPRSVDTGEFLNSVDVIQNDMSAIVFSDVEQAKFMEYGTSRIAPRRHFNNTSDRNKSEVKTIISKEISKL